MIKNSISKERHRIRDEIKELISKYEAFKQKQQQMGILTPFKQEELFQIINSIGMRYAKDGYMDQAEKWLKKAENLAAKAPRLEIILHNNLACIYNKKADFNQALYHLRRSEFMTQEMRRKSGYSINYDRLLIDCWLNLSVLFSTEKMHSEALQILKNTQQFIRQKLQNGYQKFVEQLIIAKYNKTVQLQHLGKFEQAYMCNQQTKKIMYDKRIYRHFLQKKIGDVHQDLRKKLISESKHRKSLSLAVSLNKITVKAQKLMDSHIQSKINNREKRLQSQYQSATKVAEKEDSKQNYNTVSHYEKTIQQKLRLHQKKRVSISHLPATQVSKKSIMAEITNKNL